MKIENRIDFVEIISVSNANPNGDPSNNNRPRQLENGHGEMSDVCIKRKYINSYGTNTLREIALSTCGIEGNNYLFGHHIHIMLFHPIF